MKTNLIIIEPLGGLGNRMRVIASGITLAQKVNKQLIVIWNQNKDFNCPYREIFELKNNFILTNPNTGYKRIKATNQKKIREKWKSFIVNKMNSIDYVIKESDFPNLIWPQKLDILEIAKKKRNIYICTCQEFNPDIKIFKEFIPIKELRSVIHNYTDRFNYYTLGVHIRGTDNYKSIQNSPVELFIKKLEEEIDNNQKVNFYLSTDNVEAEEILLKRFGKRRILKHTKELSRETIKGIQAAVIDMFCLANTNKIYGSYWSSFSIIASRINHIELEVIKIQKKAYNL